MPSHPIRGPGVRRVIGAHHVPSHQAPDPMGDDRDCDRLFRRGGVVGRAGGCACARGRDSDGCLADVTGDPWTYPGPGEPGGVAYVVIAQNLDCKIAQLLANNLVLGAPGFKTSSASAVRSTAATVGARSAAGTCERCKFSAGTPTLAIRTGRDTPATKLTVLTRLSEGDPNALLAKHSPVPSAITEHGNCLVRLVQLARWRGLRGYEHRRPHASASVAASAATNAIARTRVGRDRAAPGGLPGSRVPRVSKDRRDCQAPPRYSSARAWITCLRTFSWRHRARMCRLSRSGRSTSSMQIPSSGSP